MTPSQKDIVVRLMQYVGKEDKTDEKPPYVVYQCPNPLCVKQQVRFREGSGFSNPYRHLRTCYGRGKSGEEQEHILLTMYAEAEGSTVPPPPAPRTPFRLGTRAPQCTLIKRSSDTVSTPAPIQKRLKFVPSNKSTIVKEVNYRTPVPASDVRTSLSEIPAPAVTIVTPEVPVSSSTVGTTSEEGVPSGEAEVPPKQMHAASVEAEAETETEAEASAAVPPEATVPVCSASEPVVGAEHETTTKTLEVEQKAGNAADHQRRLRVLKEAGISNEQISKLLAKELGESMAAFLVNYDENNVQMFVELAQCMGEFFQQNIVQGRTICAMDHCELKNLIDTIAHYFKYDCPGGKPLGLEVNLRCFAQALGIV